MRKIYYLSSCSTYRNYILEEYTFIKRPFILIGDEVFVGNSKNTISEAAKRL